MEHRTELWFQVARGAHIALGVVAFVVAPVALATRKGGRVHRVAGWVYLPTMTAAAVTAAVLAAVTGNQPFVWIGIFGAYLGVSGYRAVRLKPGVAAGPFDRVFAIAAVLFFVAMLAAGGLSAASAPATTIPVVSFAVVGLVLSAADVRRLSVARRGAADWLTGHLAGMVSSYIAAVSAFSVVNLGGWPLPVRILWAPAVGIPLLLLWRAAWVRRARAGELGRHLGVRASGPPAGG